MESEAEFMAQKPSTNDAVTAALSAIEDALNLGHDADLDKPAEAAPAAAAPIAAGAVLHSVAAEPAPALEIRSAPTPLEAPARRPQPEPIRLMPAAIAQPVHAAITPSTAPANDDRATVGQLMQALHSPKPSRGLFFAALVGSLAWIVLCGAYVWSREGFSSLQSLANREFWLRPETALIILSALGPAIFLFCFAAFARRMQELRQSALSISQMALRLAEPESLATDQVVSLSQTIRREVAGMSDGVERALARASELDTLVRTEMASLEKVHADNDRRMRSLIAEMSDQRDAIAATGGQLRASIVEAHEGITSELEAIGQNLTSRVASTGQRVASTIGASTEEVALAAERAASTAVDRIAAQSESLQISLGAIGDEVAGRIAEATRQSANDLIERINGIDEQIRSSGQNFLRDFSENNEDIAARLIAARDMTTSALAQHGNATAERLEATHQMLMSQGDAIVSRLSEAQDQIHSSVGQLGDNLSARLSQAHERLTAGVIDAGDQTVLAIDQHGAAIAQRLENTRHVVSTQGEALADRLNQTQDQIHQSVVINGEILHARLVEANDRLADTLATRTAEAQSAFSSAHSTWNDHLDARHADIRNLLDTHAGGFNAQIVASAEQAAAAIAAQKDAFSDSIGGHSAALVDALSVQSNYLNDQIAERGKAMEAAIAARGQALINAISTQSLQMNDQIAGHAMAMEATIAARGGTLVESLSDQSKQFEHQLERFNGLVSSNGDSVLERIGAHTDNLKSTLDGQVNTLDAVMALRAAEIDSRLSDHNSTFTTLAGQRLADFEMASHSHQAGIEKLLTGRNAETTKLFENNIQMLEDRAGAKLVAMEKSLEQLLMRIETGLDTRGRSLNETLAKNTLETSRVLGEGGQDIADRLNAKSTEIEISLQTRAEALTQSLGVMAKEINATLTDKLEGMTFELAKGVNRLTGQVIEPLQVYADQIQSSSDKLSGHISEHSKSFNVSLNNALDGFESNLTGHKQDFATHLETRSRDIANEISSAIERALQVFEAQTNGLTALVSRRSEDLLASINAGTAGSVRSLGALTGQINAEVEASIAALRAATEETRLRSSEAFAALSHSLHEDLGSSALRLQTTAEASADKSTRSISDMIALLTSEVERASAALDQAMHRSSSASIATLSGTTTTSAKTVSELIARMTSEIEVAASGLTQTLESTSIASVAVLSGTAERSTNAIADLIGRLHDEVDGANATIKDAMDRSSSASVAALSGATANSTRVVSDLLSHLTAEVERASSGLAQAMEDTSGVSIAALAGTGDKLRVELTQVLERLGQTSAILERNVSNAGVNLNAVQHGLAQRSGEFQQSLSAMASQVAELGRLSAGAHAETGAIVDRLTDNTHSLTNIVQGLTESQQSVDAALQGRQESLQALIHQMTGRSVEFESLMRNFAANVEDSFNRAQTRAKEINSALMLTTNGTAATVSTQFEQIRETADLQRERTTAAMQEAYEAANAQLAGILGQATDRFRHSVAEVKSMASEVQRDLDMTRTEMRRGVLELPREANDAANEMRRVVSDQIRALKELSGIVAASGADFDVARPAAAPASPAPASPAPASPAPASPAPLSPAPLSPAPVPAAFNPAPAVVAPAGHVAPVAPSHAHAPQRRLDAIRAAEPPSAAQAPKVIELTGPSGEDDLMAAAIEALSDTRLRSSARSANPTGAAADRTTPGWLSNLLAAASRDDASPPRHIPAPMSTTADTLSNLTGNIGNLIDAEAAAEMWERWRKGDGATISRRLYTAQGQQSFDDIRRRCRTDPAFKDTVLRYTQEFERLLGQLSANDKDGSQARTYLMSDTGKVYTILAHALGRLG